MNSNSGSSAAGKPFPYYDGVWEGRMRNYTIPPRDTTYACQSMRMDFGASTVKHVVAITPIEAKKYHHHAILHVCTGNDYWDKHDPPQICASDVDQGGEGASPLGALNSGCSSLMWSWAVGGGAFILPDAAGFRVGDGEVSHLILEVHYDNPDHDVGIVDNFGFSAYYLDEANMRPHDAGGLTLGDPALRLRVRDYQLPNELSWLPIPSELKWPYESGPLSPGRSEIHRQATCPGSCTSSALEEPITVFASNLHMHYAGKKMYSELIRDGESQGVNPSMRIDYFDNGFQQLLEIEAGEFVINPGDEIQTHCWYDTSKRTKEVDFGFGTKDEMCMNFLFYYPVQYRGTDSTGRALRFANCGMFALASEIPPLSLCGGLSQTGLPELDDVSALTGLDDLISLNSLPSFFTLGGQNDRGASLYDDPIRFGEANVPVGGSSGVAAAGTCWADDQPPSSARNETSSSTHDLRLSFSAEGSLDANEAIKEAVLAKLAGGIGISAASTTTLVAYIEDLSTLEKRGPFVYGSKAARRLASGVRWILTISYISLDDAQQAQQTLLAATETVGGLTAFLAVDGLVPTSSATIQLTTTALADESLRLRDPAEERIRTNGWVISAVGIVLHLLGASLVAWHWILKPATANYPRSAAASIASATTSAPSSPPNSPPPRKEADWLPRASAQLDGLELSTPSTEDAFNRAMSNTVSSHATNEDRGGAAPFAHPLIAIGSPQMHPTTV